jgi:hypothetical protein
MSSVPLLSVKQWRAISKLLPENRRDRVVISAVLFRQFSGLGLRDVAEWFGTSRVRLAEWTAAMESDGSLQKVMEALGIQRAGPLLWSGGGQQSSRQIRDKEMADKVLALRFTKFRDALRGRSEPDDQEDPLSRLAELHGWPQ